jgi:hypothetical protein
MPKWIKGQSGNLKGRPKNPTAIAELARSQVEKHKLIEKLGSIAAREGEYVEIDVDQQLRAIQLLLAYGYGPPRPEMEGGEGIVIQVTYVETNRIAIASAAPGAVTGDPAGQAVQCGLLRAPLGQDIVGNGSADPRSTAG